MIPKGCNSRNMFSCWWANDIFKGGSDLKGYLCKKPKTENINSRC